MVHDYYWLTKPGIVRGNAITTAAGFALGAQLLNNLGSLFITVVGLSLVVASACVLNNIIDRDIDRKMSRTAERAMASGRIGYRHALIFLIILLGMGVFLLGFFTNYIALGTALFGYVMYVFTYGVAKRLTVHSTVIGSISGAVPPVVGYAAATGQLDLVALLVFLVVVFWQMPHFYAISLYRLHDYKAANLPVMPVKRSTLYTQKLILGYIPLFALATFLLAIEAQLGLVSIAITAILSSVWLSLGLKNLKTEDITIWAKKMFHFSLTVISAVCAMILIMSQVRFG